MTFPRHVPKPSTAPVPAESRKHLQTPSPPREVVSKKMEARKPTRRSESILVFSNAGGAAMFPQHARYLARNTQVHAFGGAGLLCFLLLVLFGCTIFRICRKNRSPRSTPRHGGRSRRSRETPAPDGQGSRNEQEDPGREPRGEHSAISTDGEEGELQHLTSNSGTVTPTRYCILPQHDDTSTNTNRTNTATETSFTDTARGTNGTAGVNEPSEADSAGLGTSDTKASDNTADVDSRTNTNDVEEVTASKTKDGVDPTDNRDDLTSSGNHQNSRTDSQFSESGNHQNSRTDSQFSEKSLPGTKTKDLSPQTDAASDVSEYLATLVLEVSTEQSDVTEGERTQGNSSRTTDDSVQSVESFSRLQDVKAQAEFSPYHIAWSTPLYPQHSYVRPRQTHKVPAAKRLNMDAASRKPFDCLPENRTTSTNVGSLVQTADDGDSHAPEESGTMETSEPPDWGMLKPLDAWCRPASAEYRTPRPVLHRGKYGSLGNLVGVDEDAANAEQLPLLPYSVAEYRKSLKNLSGTRSSTPSPGETVSSKQVHPAAGSPVSSRSSSSHPASFLGGELKPRRLAADVSSVGSGPNEEDTLQNVQSSSVSGAVDNTLSGLADITNSSVGDWNSSVVSMSWNDGNNQSRSCHAALDDNGDGEALSVQEMSWSRGQPTPPSSMPSFTTSSSCLLSPEADHLSSLATSSSERLADSCFSSVASPEQLCDTSDTADNEERQSLLQGLRTSSRSKSPDSYTLEPLGSFKVPYPVPAVPPSRGKGETKPGLHRSRSSTLKPLAHETLLKPGQTQLRRSKTSESLSSSLHNLQHPVSLGSWGDVSTAGSATSRLSLQDPSLTWDNEFTASGRDHDDSLTWEDDPYLS